MLISGSTETQALTTSLRHFCFRPYNGYHTPPNVSSQNIREHRTAGLKQEIRVSTRGHRVLHLFGKLKGRSRLFKVGISFGTRQKIDSAWFTACILHFVLMQLDGLVNLEKDMDWAGGRWRGGRDDRRVLRRDD